MERRSETQTSPRKHRGRSRAALGSSTMKLQYVMNIRHIDDSQGFRGNGASAVELGLTPGYAHVARQDRSLNRSIDNEIMAFGLSRDR